MKLCKKNKTIPNMPLTINLINFEYKYNSLCFIFDFSMKSRNHIGIFGFAGHLSLLKRPSLKIISKFLIDLLFR